MEGWRQRRLGLEPKTHFKKKQNRLDSHRPSHGRTWPAGRGISHPWVYCPRLCAEVHVRRFLSAFVEWASDQPDIQTVVLVGSHARNQVTDTSDIDLVILSGSPGAYCQDMEWAQRFGKVTRQ